MKKFRFSTLCSIQFPDKFWALKNSNFLDQFRVQKYLNLNSKDTWPCTKMHTVADGFRDRDINWFRSVIDLINSIYEELHRHLQKPRGVVFTIRNKINSLLFTHHEPNLSQSVSHFFDWQRTFRDELKILSFFQRSQKIISLWT